MSDARQEPQAEAAAASENLDADVLGAQTRAWQYGEPEGAPIVLVHGFRGDHHGLEGLARALVARLPGTRVIVPDLPGFGESPAIPGRRHDLDLYGEWMRGFTRAVAPHGHAILGHSFGSLVVSNSLAQGLDSSAIMLINPISAPALEGPQAAMTQLAIAYYRAADLLPERPARALLGNPLIVRVMSEVMAKTGDRDLRGWIHDQHDRYFSRFSDTTTLLEAFRASVSHTVADYVDAFDRPTLLVAGDRDDITPLSAQLALHRRIPGSRFRVIPGVGHLVHYEAVDDAVAEIAAFLTSVSVERTAERAAGRAGEKE